MKTVIVLIILACAALLMWFAVPAQAASCGPFDIVLRQWAAKYKEIPVAGDFKGTVKIILFMSPEATWTIFYVRPDGLACFQASGNDWESFKPEKPGVKS